MPRQIIMPFDRAKMAAQAVLPHVSSNDVTPVLTLAVVRDGRIIATDRYSVGEFILQEGVPDGFKVWSADQQKGWREHRTVELSGTLGEDDPTWEDDFSIPRAALQRISTLSKAMTLHGVFAETKIVVREEFGEWRQSKSAVVVRRDPTARSRDRRIVVEVVTGSIVEWSQRFAVAEGNFPPVGRLLNEWKPQEDGGPVHFNLMGSNLSKIIRFAGKHTPIRVTAGAGIGEKKRHKIAPMLVEVGTDFRALIQPNLDLR